MEIFDRWFIYLAGYVPRSTGEQYSVADGINGIYSIREYKHQFTYDA